MFTGELKVGDKLIWRHVYPTAYARCEVARIDLNGHIGEDVVWMKDGEGDEFCAVYPVVLDNCMRDPFECDFMFGEPSLIRERWLEAEKTAAQPDDRTTAENPGEPSQD